MRDTSLGNPGFVPSRSALFCLMVSVAHSVPPHFPDTPLSSEFSSYVVENPQVHAYGNLSFASHSPAFLLAMQGLLAGGRVNHDVSL